MQWSVAECNLVQWSVAECNLVQLCSCVVVVVVLCSVVQCSEAKQHLSLQKQSEPLVFCALCLRNVLRATTACTFLTSQLPKVVRDHQFLTLLTSKYTTRSSRHNGVHFFDISTSKSAPKLECFVHFGLETRHNGVQLSFSHLTTWLRTRRFSEPTFGPSGA